MPCHDSRDEPSNVRAEALREYRHNSPVAELLCEAMKELESQKLLRTCSPALLQWWDGFWSTYNTVVYGIGVNALLALSIYLTLSWFVQRMNLIPMFPVFRKFLMR